jgi:HAD superfamily hydrolase (TIGR01509 family)
MTCDLSYNHKFTSSTTKNHLEKIRRLLKTVKITRRITMEPIRKFNRFELKYLLTMEQTREFKQQLEAYMFPDQYAWNSGDYVISSLYYDSPDLQCYWEKIDGLKFRKKLRVRIYETEESITEDSIVFVEIKQRYDKTIQKRRIAIPYRDAIAVASGADRTIVTSLMDKFYPGIFDAIISGEDVENGKPDPEPYEKAIAKLGLSKDECLVVENAPLGVESAKNAGVFCVGVPTYLDESKLKEADFVVRNHSELIEYLTDLKDSSV